MDLKKYLKIDGNKGYLKVKVVPNSNKTEFFNLMDDGTLKIRIKAIPEKGKANKELIEYLSKNLGVSKLSINILSGAGNREKLIRIDF